MILYEWVDGRGRGILSEWVRSKEVREHMANLDQALDRLEQARPDSLPGIMVGPLAPSLHIYKLRLGGKVRLRPMLCKGPVRPDAELTFLQGAFERNHQLDPRDAVERADERRLEVLERPQKRKRYVRDEDEAD